MIGWTAIEYIKYWAENNTQGPIHCYDDVIQDWSLQDMSIS